MNASFDALYFSPIVSFLWIRFYMVKAWFKRDVPASVLETFSTQSLFSKPFIKTAFLFYEGFFWAYLKFPPFPSIYVYISECQLPWVCFAYYTKWKSMSIKYAGPIILELELINLDFPLFFRY